MNNSIVKINVLLKYDSLKRRVIIIMSRRLKGGGVR